jgi:hypothetical protein
MYGCNAIASHIVVYGTQTENPDEGQAEWPIIRYVPFNMVTQISFRTHSLVLTPPNGRQCLLHAHVALVILNWKGSGN